MNNRMHQWTQELRPSERGAVPAHALPVNLRFDLSQFLAPEALDDEATERWIERQQLPRQLRGLGLEFALHEVLRRRWRTLLAHLSAGLIIAEDEDKRVVKISDVMVFQVWYVAQHVAAGFADGNCFRWFSFNVVRPLPSVMLIGRLLRSERTYELHLPEHLLNQPLPEAREDDRWQLLDLKYFPNHVFGYAGGRIIERMRRMFLSRRFNELLCRALALDRNDLLAVMRARPAKGERHALNSFFWNDCMRHREQLRAVATARPLLLPLFGAMVLANDVRKEDSPDSVLKKLLVYPENLRIRYQRNPFKSERV